jgi:hypothetical protein
VISCSLFSFGCGPRAGGVITFQGHSRGNHPFDYVALGMSVPHDVALLIHVLALSSHDSGVDVAVCIRQADVIENDVEISLADKVAWLLGCFQMSGQVGAARECGVTELGELAEVAKHGVANLRGFRLNSRIVYCAMEQGSCRYERCLGLCGWLQTQQEQREQQ